MYEHYLNHFFGRKLLSEFLTKKNLGLPVDKPKSIKDDFNITDTVNINEDFDNIPDNLPPMVKSVFEKLKALKVIGKLDTMTSDDLNNIIAGEFNEVLGAPTEEESIKRDGVTIERKIWELDNHQKFATETNVIRDDKKVRTIDDAKKELSVAVKEENYERAAELRNEIKDLGKKNEK